MKDLATGFAKSRSKSRKSRPISRMVPSKVSEGEKYPQTKKTTFLFHQKGFLLVNNPPRTVPFTSRGHVAVPGRGPSSMSQRGYLGSWTQRKGVSDLNSREDLENRDFLAYLNENRDFAIFGPPRETR